MSTPIDQQQQLPSIALSIRQPWAWLIVNGWKNIENRTWKTPFRGPVLIHAGKSMTRGDYNACLFFVGACMPTCAKKIPPYEELDRGGIVGVATVLDCVDYHPSEWFCGDWGFVMADARPLPFTPCKGALGFFTNLATRTLANVAWREHQAQERAWWDSLGEEKQLELLRNLPLTAQTPPSPAPGSGVGPAPSRATPRAPAR